MVSNKVFIAVLIITIVLVSVAFSIALDLGGLGKAVKGFGGPLAKGAYNIFSVPFTWALSGGWPTLAGAIGVVVFLMLLSAYATWHYEIPYKITGVTSPSPASNYTNTMSREPADPEVQQKTTTTK